MEKIVLDGKVFVKAAQAADELGYTRDYIGQLCRGGKVDAHLVGRSWYVDQSQLRVHKREKKRSTKAKAKEQVKESLAAVKSETEDSKAYKSRITYEPDDEELIPKVKKLAVNEKDEAETKKDTKSAKAAKKKEQKKKDAEPDYVVVNEGEKTVMSGKLEITDANEEEGLLDEPATVMHAKVVEDTDDKKDSSEKKHADEKRRSDKEKKAISDTRAREKDSETEGAEKKEKARKSFREKLALLEEEEKESSNTPPTEDQRNASEATAAQPEGAPLHRSKTEHTDRKTPNGTKKTHPERLWPAHVGIIFTLAVAFAAIGLETNWSYDVAHADQPAERVETTYNLSFQRVVETLR